MAFFRKPLVFLISNSSVVEFDTNKKTKSVLNFSSEYVQFAELINQNKFNDAVQSFIEKLKLRKQEAIILLSKELVFTSNIGQSNNNLDNEAEKFLSLLPIQKNNASVILIKNADGHKFLATNKKLYEALKHVLFLNEIGVGFVSPVNVLPKIPNVKEISFQEVKKIAGSKKVFEKYNFLKGYQSILPEKKTKISKKAHTDDDEEGDGKNSAKQIIFLILSLLLLGSSVGYLFVSGTVSSPWFNKTDSLSSTPSPSSKIPVSTPSATLEPVSKSELIEDKTLINIQVLNGSEIAGQASKISELLQGIDFENITIGNIDNYNDRTTITYNKLLAEDLLAEITDEIENDYPDPTIKVATQTSEFDVVITIGSF